MAADAAIDAIASLTLPCAEPLAARPGAGGNREIYKVIHPVKRKPHLTHELFRDHFERSHAAMAVRYCGHLFSEYRRNYVNTVLGGGDPRIEGSGFGLME